MNRLSEAEQVLRTNADDLGSYCIHGYALKYSEVNSWRFRAIYERGGRVWFVRFVLQFRHFGFRYAVRAMESVSLTVPIGSDLFSQIGLREKFQKIRGLRSGFQILRRIAAIHLLVSHNGFRRKWKLGVFDPPRDAAIIIADFMEDVGTKVDTALRDSDKVVRM